MPRPPPPLGTVAGLSAVVFCYNRVMDEHDKNLVKWYKSVATVLGIILGVMVVAIIINICLR